MITARKMFPLKVSSVNVTKSALQIWSQLLKKFLIKNFIYCVQWMCIESSVKHLFDEIFLRI